VAERSRRFGEKTHLGTARQPVARFDYCDIVKAREDFQNIINKKDEMLVSEQRKASEIRDQSESKMFELKTAFIELQKELEGIQNLNTQLKKQISQLEKERDSQADLALRKDNTIDKLKEEVVLMSKALQKTSQPSMPQDTAKELYEKVSSVEFARLRQLTDELKNKEIELERYRIQSELQERQYLTLKQQATAALEEKNNSKRAADSVRYENEKLKEEQDKFIDELSEIRQIYESQIDDLATKLHSSAEEVIKQKAKCSELTKENNILKYRLDEFKRRVASRDVEIQKLTSEHLFEAEGIPRAKPTDILASPSIVKVQLENESQFDMVSPEVKENGQKTLNKLRMMDEHEPKHDLWQEDKQKLDWDSLFYKLSTLGTK
jgi:chromosome segregation ATPase